MTLESAEAVGDYPKITEENFCFWSRVPTTQGKPGKWKKKVPCQGKHREFDDFAKRQGISIAQVIPSLILNNYTEHCSQYCVCVTIHVDRHRENVQLDRESTGNLKVLFEWCPDGVFLLVWVI